MAKILTKDEMAEMEEEEAKKTISGPLGLTVFIINKIAATMYNGVGGALTVFTPFVDFIDYLTSPLEPYPKLHLYVDCLLLFIVCLLVHCLLFVICRFVLALVQCGCLFLGLVFAVWFANYCVVTSRGAFSAKRIKWKAASKRYARDHFRYKTFTITDVDETVENMPHATINTILNATASELRGLMAKDVSVGGVSCVTVLSLYISRASSLGRECRASTVSALTVSE